jgi:hypothetical protein
VAGVNALSWDLPDDLSQEEWVDAGIILLARILSWWIGDWWAYGEARYGARKAIVAHLNWQGPSFQACMNAASVCRTFPTSRRREVLTFKHHAEVAPLEPQEADRLLDWCEETVPITGNPRSARDLRSEVSRARRMGEMPSQLAPSKFLPV